jgi:hypothetical protein
VALEREQADQSFEILKRSLEGHGAGGILALGINEPY